MAGRLTPTERMHRMMSEREFQRHVQGFLAAGGFRWYHAPDNRPVANAHRRQMQNVRRGFPDLVGIKPGRAVALELKRETGNDATAEQLAWLDDFAALGWEVGVFRPSDLPLLEAALARGVGQLPPWRSTR